jgi:serine/threonine-protein kinase
VIEQNPAKHTRLELGTAVDLVIGSLGENPVTLPDFRRGNRDAAEAAIRDLGLNLRRVTTEQTEQQPPGTVIKQSPRPNSQYARGCNVNVDLVVAVPVVYVEVGDYVNMPQNEASRSLSEDKLYAFVTYQESPNSAPGIVVSQDPPKGSRVRQGTMVHLVVTVPPTITKVTVPPVVGRKLDEAKRQLESLGLTVVVTTKDYCDENPGGQARNNTILSQDTPPDRKVPVGTTIGLVVNRLVCLF